MPPSRAYPNGPAVALFLRDGPSNLCCIGTPARLGVARDPACEPRTFNSTAPLKIFFDGHAVALASLFARNQPALHRGDDFGFQPDAPMLGGRRRKAAACDDVPVRADNVDHSGLRGFCHRWDPLQGNTLTTTRQPSSDVPSSPRRSHLTPCRATAYLRSHLQSACQKRQKLAYRASQRLMHAASSDISRPSAES